MEIAWVLSSTYKNEGILTADVMKEHGPIWAPYSVWGQAGQDNVITDEFNVARQLMNTNFHTSCNLWFNDDFWVKLGRPTDISTYDWKVSVEIPNKEEIIALQMASTRYDIICAVGFDLHGVDAYKPKSMEKHLRQNYVNYMTAIVKMADETQFVFIDPAGEDVHAGLTMKENFSTDTAENALELLKSL